MQPVARPVLQELTAAQARGRREHKHVNRLTFENAGHNKGKSKSILPGHGTALSSIESISKKLTKASSDQIEDLHRLLYGRPGSRKSRLRNIKKFSGFTDAEPNLEPKIAMLSRMTLKRRKELLTIMCLLPSAPDGGSNLSYGVEPLLAYLRAPFPFGCELGAKEKCVDSVLTTDSTSNPHKRAAAPPFVEERTTYKRIKRRVVGMDDTEAESDADGVQSTRDFLDKLVERVVGTTIDGESN